MSKKKFKFIRFGAKWCGPCKQFAPVFDRISEKYSGKADFVYIDIDLDQETPNQYQVMTIPTVVAVGVAGPVGVLIGMKSEEDLETFVKESMG